MLPILLCLSVWWVASSTAIEKPFYDFDKVEQLFEEYVTSFNKSYANNEEKQVRLDIFKENLKEIIYLNENSKAAAYGVNHFTDMTTEEARNHYMGLEPRGDYQTSCKIITDAEITTNEAPDSLDYREKNIVTPVKNQLRCQCCWAFATIGSIEGQYALKNQQLMSFSEQQLMDCLQISGHCAKGSYMDKALSELMTLPGVETEAEYPYAGRDLRCAFDRSKARVRVTGCINYRLRDENKLKEALYQNGPIAIAINGDDITNYHGGILDVIKCPPQTVDHAVLLVGYGSEGGEDYWLIKNSWGSENWGEQGYLKISRGQNTCGLMNDYPASAVVA